MQEDRSSTHQIVESICTAFAEGDAAQPADVPKAKVLEWMHSEDLQVRGAVYTMIVDVTRARRVRPALQFDDYYEFVMRYLEQCIEQDPSGEWVDSRYLAAHGLVAWIFDFWNNEDVPRARLSDAKRRLAALYRRGDKDVRDAVINGVLEHLFENRQLAAYFEDWQNDPMLRHGYEEALLWKKKAPEV